MSNQLTLLYLIFFSSIGLSQSLPSVKYGKIVRLEAFKSSYVASRNVDIWLPKNYDGKKKYSVLYMHDGQMLFDSTLTWNRQSWNVAETISSLMEAGKIKDVIVVGIWNVGALRHTDYFPQRVYSMLSNQEKDSVIQQLRLANRIQTNFTPNSDNYLKFIVEELKPYIDKHYQVHKDRKHTFMAGSSMGGLISLYGICEYPKIFGGVACLSTHWVGTFTLRNNPIPAQFLNYLAQKLPNPQRNKIYFDCGDKTLDALYPEIQQKVDKIMIEKGFTSKNWNTRYFEGKDHSEKAWAERLPIPLTFLLEK
jgi:enterochelin esterase-like enzyme